MHYRKILYHSQLIEKGDRMKLKLFIVFAITVICLASGCSSIEDIGLGGSGASTTMFSDLTVPEGFVLNESESYYEITATARSGHLVYSGWKEASQLVIFYQEQLSDNNWTMVSINITGYAGTLLYDKTSESLMIGIEGDVVNKATLTIDLAPD